MAVTWLSQPNSARSTISRRRRLASGPASQEAPPSPRPLQLRPVPPATPYYPQPRLRRRSVGHRVASVDAASLDDVAGRRRSYALFSPYVPLPAIGGDAPEKDNREVMDKGDAKGGAESADKPRFLRERTYSVIEPVLVRGPTHQWALPVKPKMVTPAEAAVGATDAADSGTLSKLRQTLSSGLLTAQDKVTKLSPGSRSSVSTAFPEQPQAATPPDDRASTNPATDTAATTTATQRQSAKSNEPVKPPCRSGACRVCLKSLKPEDVVRVCGECHFKVCDDCASYSKQDQGLDNSSWRCSICRRKLQSRPLVAPQDSTDSLLDIPVLEALQRRHSDVKVASGVSSGGNTAHGGPVSLGGATLGGSGGLGSGLAPPRSPELRRHSDVSPASLKELEKVKIHVAGERRGDVDWKRGRPTAASPAVSRAASPQGMGERLDGSISPGPPGGGPPGGPGGRRRSRVQKQHSYDDELKGSGQSAGGDTGLGLPAALPRRASAYDVYQSGGAISPQALAAAAGSITGGVVVGSNVSGGVISAATGSVAVPPLGGTSVPAVDVTVPITRRASFRGPPGGSHPLSPDAGPSEEERRSRRRGSQLPDIATIRAAQAHAQANKSRSPPIVGAPGPPGPTVPTGPPGPVTGPAAAPPLDETPPVVTSPPSLVVDPMRRQGSVTDGEAIKIVIDDVDSELLSSRGSTGAAGVPGAKRRIVLHRDPNDKGHRTRGLGMRVVGGKVGPDGRLFAYIVWTVPGGVAEKGGLQPGDKVLDWDGVPLTDRSFEEVCSVMDRTGDVVELLVEHSADLRMCDLVDDAGAFSSTDALGLQQPDGDVDKSPASPTRRKLPKTPEQLAREKVVTGRVQLQVWFHEEKDDLVVSLLAADDLAGKDDIPPRAFARMRLLPVIGENRVLQTEVAEPGHNPVWNATLEFPGVPADSLMERTIEVQLWDDNTFLGECEVELQKAFLEDRPVWYRLDDPRALRSGGIGRSPHASPRGSLAYTSDVAQRLLRRSERSVSEDSESGACSPEFAFALLHPDHAWSAMGSNCSSRRGSSQSEQLEVETYQLDRDFSRSQPGSRRSSFQSGRDETGQNSGNVDNDLPPINFNKERRRSSCTRGSRDPDEILRSLKAVKGELLGRTLSLSGEAKRAHRRKGRKHSVMETGTSLGGERLALQLAARLAELRTDDPADDDNAEDDPTSWLLPLGPGQIRPRGYRMPPGLHGNVEISLLMTKGQLELVIKKAAIVGFSPDNPPDTYVKTYLRDGDRWLQKRKTRVVRRSTEPQYNQTLRYSACDVLGRSLVVMLWERQKGFEHNQGLGGAEVALDKLTLTQATDGIYPLFPIHSLGSDSNDSP